MNLNRIVVDVIPAAYALLPARLDSDQATVMLLAIGLQESRFEDRRQIGGPARSFWQAEQGGGMVHGVRVHVATADMAWRVYTARGVAPNDAAIYVAIEHDDILACALARLLLWTDPEQLPALGDAEGAWQLYLRTWRPGAYTRGTPAERAALRVKWGEYYLQALAEVAS